MTMVMPSFPLVRGRLPALAFFCCSLTAGISFVGHTFAGVLNLPQAYALALERDATLRAARAGATAANEQLPQAVGQWRPNVSLSASRFYNDLLREPTSTLTTPTPEQYASYNQTLSLRQPVLRKPLWDNLTQARFRVEDAQAGLDREVQNLSVRLVGAYLENLLSQDQLALVQVQHKLITSQLDAAQKSFAAGSGIRTDIDEAQARLDLNKAQTVEAKLQVEMTLRQLEAIINQPVERLAPLNASHLLGLKLEDRSLSDWIALAEAQSPEIKSMQARLEVARLEIAKAQGAHLPTLDAIAQVMRSGSENVLALNSNYTNRLIGVQLNLPLYSGGLVDSSVRQAVASFEQAQQQLEATRRDLGVRVHREYRGIIEGPLRIKAQEQALVSADQWVISSQRSYQAGNRTVIDVLNAEQQRQVVLRDLMQARYLLFLSKVKLVSLAGLDVTPLLSDGSTPAE